MYASESTTVKLTSNQAWKAISDQSWVWLSATEGTNDATITMQAESNRLATARMARVTFITTTGSPQVSRTIVITQPGQDGAPTIGVALSDWTLPSASAASVSTSVASNSLWSASSSQSWVSVSASNPNSSGEVTIAAQANTSASPRTATITFRTTSGTPQASATMTVTQPGAQGGPPLSVDMSEWRVPSESSAGIYMGLSTASSWTVTSSNTSWLTMSPTSGTGDKSVYVYATYNAGAARTATLTFATATTPKTTWVVTVVQPGALPGAALSSTGGDSGVDQMFVTQTNRQRTSRLKKR